MENNIKGLHHVSLIVSDTGKSLEFYCGILGLETAERPALDFPGAWLKVGNQQIHLRPAGYCRCAFFRAGHVLIKVPLTLL